MDMPERLAKDTVMAEAISPRHTIPILAAAGIVGVLLALTIALWVHYGTAVFFEVIRSGLVACFG